MANSSRNYVSPRNLAAAVDVSESSLKRWADDGLLEVSRTAGGHRRIPVSEAIRFVRERQLRLVNPSLLGLPDLGVVDPDAGPPEGAQLEALFVEHRGRDAAQVVLASYLGGVSIAELCDGPIRQALTVVGELYVNREEGVAIEHGAVDACLQGLNAIRQLLVPRAGAPVAIGGAIESDPYILPSLCVAMVLEEIGFRAINIGPNTPASAILATARSEAPTLLWRSLSAVPRGEEWLRDVTAVQQYADEAGCAFVVGGRACRSARGHLGGSHAFESLQELSGFGRALLAAKGTSTEQNSRESASPRVG